MSDKAFAVFARQTQKSPEYLDSIWTDFEEAKERKERMRKFEDQVRIEEHELNKPGVRFSDRHADSHEN